LKKVAKIKDVNEKSKIRSKFSVGVKDLSSGKYEVEYVEVQFFSEDDRKVFTRVYKQVAGINEDDST
jgi:uncharacterized radical SAM superfamily protein